jgi:hypothetical protein
LNQKDTQLYNGVEIVLGLCQNVYLSIIRSLAARLAVGYGVDVTHLSLFLLGRYYYCYPAPFIFANSLCAINSKEEEKNTVSSAHF